MISSPSRLVRPRLLLALSTVLACILLPRTAPGAGAAGEDVPPDSGTETAAASPPAPQAGVPGFSLPAGFYAGEQLLELKAPGGTVHYTLFTPDPEHPDRPMAPKVVAEPYTRPLRLAATSVVRAYAEEPGKRRSPLVTRTFVIGENHSLPFVSLATDPANLFDEKDGIYMPGPEVGPDDVFPYWKANFFLGHDVFYQGSRKVGGWRDYEVPVHVEYFPEDGGEGFSLDAGLEMMGGWSRGLAKKSFNVKTRKHYGRGRISFRLFAENPYDTYDGLTLRAGAQDRSRIRNEVVSMARRDAALRVDMQAYRPAILLINGVFWGIYSVMERNSKDLVVNRHGHEDVLFFKERLKADNSALSGEVEELLRDYDAADDRTFSRVLQRVDLDSFIDNWLLNVYFGRHDIDNSSYWHRRAPDAKLHWICYDFDWWSPSNFPTMRDLEKRSRIPDNDSWMLFAMLRHDGFRARFINRVADFLNTAGSAESLTKFIDRAVDDVKDDIGRDIERWERYEDGGGGGRYGMSEYRRDIASTRRFAARRPGFLREHLAAYFKLPGTATVALDSRGGGGSIRINTLDVAAFPWKGTYFKGVPVTVTAVPDAGYAFAGWERRDPRQEGTLTLDLAGDVELTAGFTPVREP